MGTVATATGYRFDDAQRNGKGRRVTKPNETTSADSASALSAVLGAGGGNADQATD